MEMVRGIEMDIFKWLGYWLSDESTKLIYILTLIFIANILDFLFGWVNAKFNPNVSFASSKAIFGIARKILMVILLVFFVPVAMLVPQPVGVGALYVLYLGYLASEINSILNHLKLAEDDKRNDLFVDFIQKIFKGSGKK